ncbi:MAG: hypothetical protein P8P74_02400 [Crocinitomicaceae bacterium]|nr:hypothetical protein [Crocinitomicaceae bacterium]
MKDHLLLFNFVTLALIAILGILTSLKFKKNELPWKIIALYLIGSFVTNVITYVFWEMKWNNLKILHIYSIFQFVSFSAFYWSTTRNRTKQLLILVFSGTITGLLILNSIWFESLQDFNSMGIFISNGTLIVYSVAYFFEVLGAEVNAKKFLIVNAGILVFISESLVVFLFGNFLKKVALIDQAVLWYTHISTYIIFLLLILWNHAKLDRIR